MELIAGLSHRRSSTLRHLINDLGDLGSLLVVTAEAPQRRPGRKLKAGEVVQIVQLYRDGMAVGQIAHELGISKATVIRRIAESEEPKRVYRKVHGELLEEIRAQYLTGSSLRALAVKFSLTRGAIRDGLVTAGLEIRSR